MNGDILQITHMLLSVTKRVFYKSSTAIYVLYSVSSLNKDVNVLNVHIFVRSWLVGTEPELNIISGGLWKISAEPMTLLTASFSSSKTIMFVPQSIIISICIATLNITEEFLSHE